MNNVQAFVNNISVPKTLEELQFFIDEHGCYNVEDILQDSETEWTAPFWAKPGDIVFFMHAKTACSYLTAMRTQLQNDRMHYPNEKYSEMIGWIKRGLNLHKKYGGKIFAVAKVAGFPEYNDDDTDIYHWSSRIYACMDKICVLEQPIDISEFNNQIFISRQSGITPILGDDFEYHNASNLLMYQSLSLQIHDRVFFLHYQVR